MAQHVISHVSGNVTTADNVQTTVGTLDLASFGDCAVQIKIDAVARKKTGDMATISVVAAARSVSGVVSVVGIVQDNVTLMSDLSMAAIHVTIDASSTVLRGRVIGLPGIKIDWLVDMTVRIV